MAGVTLYDLGGPVYPQETLNADGSTSVWYGMALRDFFAAVAMHAVLASDGRPTDAGRSEAVSEWAYTAADAMLAARERLEAER